MDGIIMRLEANMSNNYKDNAQDNLKELKKCFEELCSKGKISKKNKEKYGKLIEGYEERLEGFTHKDQKPYWV